MGSRRGSSQGSTTPKAQGHEADNCNEHVRCIARRQRAKGTPRQHWLITPGEAQKPWETVEGSAAPIEAPGWEELK